jgi:hypothetical protein
MKTMIKALGSYLGIDRKSAAYLRKQFPEATPKDIELMTSVQPFTRTPPARLWALIQSVRYVVSRGILGTFVECGTWKGGSSMVAAQEFKRLENLRDLWLFDTFEGMSEPTTYDIRINDGLAATEKWQSLRQDGGGSKWCDVDIGEVQTNMQKTGYPPDKIRFIKGKVEETLRVPHNVPEQIAILRLDTDWYTSTKAEMESLFPRVSLGGILIVDDYGTWAGSKRAVDEYFNSTGVDYLMNRIDKASRLVVKI